MTLIGYARCSGDTQNLNLQIDTLKAAGCSKIFTEFASGGDDTRPELAAALAFCRHGDVFMIWKLDRAARSLLHLAKIAAELRLRRIDFRSLTEHIDTTTPAGKFTFHILGAAAEFERDIIRERTMAGLAAARARGRIGGRPKGYSPLSKPGHGGKRTFMPRAPAFCDD